MFSEMKQSNRLAALWATVVTVVASVTFYIPISYAKWHHLELSDLPPGYKWMARGSGVVLVPGMLTAYCVGWILLRIWGWTEMARLAFLRAWLSVTGLKQTQAVGSGKAIGFALSGGFRFSAWWLLPLTWLFYFAIFSTVFRLSRHKRAQTP